MTLIEVIGCIRSYDGDGIIYAKEPFSEGSEAFVHPGEVRRGERPAEAFDRNLVQFLAVDMAIDLLDASIDSEFGPRLDIHGQCAMLIHYSLFDA